MCDTLNAAKWKYSGNRTLADGMITRTTENVEKLGGSLEGPHKTKNGNIREIKIKIKIGYRGGSSSL